MEYIPAKTIITRSKRPEYWFGTEYNMNIKDAVMGAYTVTAVQTAMESLPLTLSGQRKML